MMPSALGSCLFNNVSFLSKFINVMSSMNGFAYTAQVQWLVNLVVMSVSILSALGLNYKYIPSHASILYGFKC